MNIEGAAAIVTGGASGIGEASARLLARHGARCVIIDRDQDNGSTVAEHVGGIFVQADVTDEEKVQAAIDVAAGIGPLRAVVNAAGVGTPSRVLDRDGSPMPLKFFERVVRINLIGTFNCLRLTASTMAKNAVLDGDGSRGAIVNISSTAAFDGQIGQAAYSASKAAVVGMTLPLARDLASVGIRVNTIAPGIIDTPIYGVGEQAEALKAKLASNLVFPKRFGTPEELASMVLALLTNDYVNGETIRVDGGVRLPPR